MHRATVEPNRRLPSELAERSVVGRVSTDDEPSGTLDLSQAVAIALRRNADLAAAGVEIRAQEGAVLQAGVRPNPVLGATVENIGGTAGSRFAESTVQLGQTLELGGKRPARVRLAALGRELARWDLEVRRNALLRLVVDAYVDVLTAQERLVVASDLVRLAEQSVATVGERVRAGRVPPIEETRAAAALASTQLERTRVERELEAARRRLAATWGSSSPRFDAVVGGRLVEIPPLPAFGDLAERLAKNPEAARWETELEQRRAALALEQARAVPDVTVHAGPRWPTETQDLTFVVGISVPLPVFDRNEGAILEARRRIEKAEYERDAARTRLVAALGTAFRELSTAAAEVTTLQRDILPAAQIAFDTISEGYRLGRFALLDVLEAQRALFDARSRLVRAIGDFRRAIADVERLVDAPVGELAPGVMR
jgi:cobalt-zinc-cadmium efflux system outer membrane protein